MYFAFAAIYIVLTVVFITLVVRQQSLYVEDKAVWILALLATPPFAWVIYGIRWMRHDRGL